MTNFAIGTLEWALGASVAVTLDALNFANQVATALGKRPVTWTVMGKGTRTHMTNGLVIKTEPIRPGMKLGRSVLVIPGIGLDHPDLIPIAAATPSGSIPSRYSDSNLACRMEMPDVRQFARLAKDHHERGGWVCASCSGVLVLASAGLLSSRKATTHWQIAGFLARRFPEACMDVTRMVVEDRRVVTAGAAMAQMDLMLHLIRMVMGHDVADLTMKYMLIDSRPTQARYMVWSQLQTTDEIVRDFEVLIESSLATPITVSDAAQKLHMTEKTLARRVFKASGSTPTSLIQSVRMRHVQHLLDTTNLPLGEIAIRVGYANATSLRKMTLKFAKTTPGMLRKRLLDYQ
jgi:transcriptional regulator GlxA family with amidase domain